MSVNQTTKEFANRLQNYMASGGCSCEGSGLIGGRRKKHHTRRRRVMHHVGEGGDGGVVGGRKRHHRKHAFPIAHYNKLIAQGYSKTEAKHKLGYGLMY